MTDDPQNWTDADLVRLAKRGDHAAWTVIYERYRGQINAHAYRMMDDTDTAQEITNDCFLKVWRALPGMDPDGPLHLSAYLHRAASNLCIDHLRRRQRIRWVPWEPHSHDDLLSVRSEDADPATIAERQERQRTVRDAMNQISPRHRLALYLREWQGLSCTEIGLALGVSRSAVKSMLFRARGELRAILLERINERAGAA